MIDLTKVQADALVVTREVGEVLADQVEKTSASAVATALVRLLAALVANEANGSPEEIAKHFSEGLRREVEFARSSTGATAAVDSSRERTRQRALRPARRRLHS